MAVIKLSECIKNRVKKLRNLMKIEQIDAYILTNVADVTYMTGFSGDDSVLVVTAKKVVLLSDSRFTEQLKQECPKLKVKLRDGSMAAAAAAVLLKDGKKGTAGVVAINEADISVADFNAYKKSLGKGVKGISRLINKIRMYKDDFEIAQITKAIRIAEKSLAETLKIVKPGMTELQLAAHLEYQMQMNGALMPGFPSIVAFGLRAAQCHAVPGSTRLKKNVPFLIDFGAKYNGYISDLTRCFCIGKIRPEFADAYKYVLEAQLKAIDTIAPGVPLADVDAAARSVIPAKMCYSHGTGHGLGLNVHEAPGFSPKATGNCEAGMVLTVEPGIYIGDKFGIRIEDDILVTAKGHKVLSKLPKGLDSVIL
ncbi:MAG: aminopeptidase P family protein [Phycisphaerae bacterium]|nr:aminopeptidase P family protein [Phycisphaerae bacterium]